MRTIFVITPSGVASHRGGRAVREQACRGGWSVRQQCPQPERAPGPVGLPQSVYGRVGVHRRAGDRGLSGRRRDGGRAGRPAADGALGGGRAAGLARCRQGTPGNPSTRCSTATGRVIGLNLPRQPEGFPWLRRREAWATASRHRVGPASELRGVRLIRSSFAAVWVSWSRELLRWRQLVAVLTDGLPSCPDLTPPVRAASPSLRPTIHLRAGGNLAPPHRSREFLAARPRDRRVSGG